MSAVARQWSRLSKSAVLLLLAVVVLGQFLATEHELTVRHVVCAEHGELIDVDSSAAASAASAPGTQATSANTTEQQNHHQHCMIVASRDRRNGFVLARVALIRHSTAKEFAPTPQALTVHSTVAVYLAAPKNSPPSAS